MLHRTGRAEFAVGADGRHEADLSLLLLAIGDNGQPVNQARLQVPLRLDDEAYALLRQRGLLYSARLGIKDPGGYQIRAAVQDDRSKALGTSAQFVEVPKVGKDHVALSGVVMMDVAVAGAPPSGGAPAATAMRTDVIADGVLGEPAVKIFKPGSEVAYTFEIYDGRGKRRTASRPRHAAARRQGFYTTPRRRSARRARTPSRSARSRSAASCRSARPAARHYTLQVSVAPQSGKGRDRQPHSVSISRCASRRAGLPAGRRARAVRRRGWKTNSGSGCPFGSSNSTSSAAALHAERLLQVVDRERLEIGARAW